MGRGKPRPGQKPVTVYIFTWGGSIAVCGALSGVGSEGAGGEERVDAPRKGARRIRQASRFSTLAVSFSFQGKS